MYYLPNNIFSKLFKIISLLGFKYSIILILKKLYSKNYYFILQKKLGNENFPVKRRFQYKFNIITESQINEIISNLHLFDVESRKEILARLVFLNSGFRNCFVATNYNDDILYMQWIIYPNENNIIKEKYGGLFSQLKKNQVMLENAFTFPKYRGLQIYSRVTIDLMNKARSEGYKSCIVYVKTDNLIALNELKKIGFIFTKRILERKILGITKRKIHK